MFLMPRKILHLLLALGLTASALAQQPQRAAVDAPDVEQLRTHIAYLASDKLEGRRVGTPGADAAARYIAEEFAQIGLRPGVGDRQAAGKERASVAEYMQQFSVVAGVELGQGNAMTLTTTAAGGNEAASLDLRLKEDWMPLGWSANAGVKKLPAVFVGYGIAAKDLGYDDYVGVDLTNRIAVVFAGTPDGDNPHGDFARYAELRFKAVAAREQGARALIVIAREENFGDDKLARLRFDRSAGDAGIAVVAISRAAARRILEAGRTPAPLDELEKSLRARRSSSSIDANKSSSQQAHTNSSAVLQGVVLGIETNIVRREVPAANVVGLLEGTDPQLKNEAVVIGAHYDHLGRGGEGSLAAREGEVHHGADDNASGTAGLIELARLFAKGSARPRRTILFIAFGGEEAGLLGSSYYVNQPAVPLARTVAMINMDMIGRLKDDRLMIGGVGTATEWRRIIGQINTEVDFKVAVAGDKQDVSLNNMPIVTGSNGEAVVTASTKNRFALTLNEDGFGPSDHASFYAKQIPVLFLFTGTHEDYHKPSDTADRVNYAGEARIVAFVYDIVRALDTSGTRPTYAVTRTPGSAGRGSGFRVYLGTIPNYAETTDGMRLDAVREDSPAAKAGLRAGDRIVRMAGREIRNVYDYTYALSEMRAGQEYEVEVIRGTERLSSKITPETRK